MRLNRKLAEAAALVVASITAWAPAKPATLGPVAGMIAIVQADTHHPGTLLAGTSTALLFRSTDRGNSWSPLPFPAALRSTLHAVLIDPDRPDVYLVAVTSEIQRYAGVFRSADGGQSWRQLPGMAGIQVWSLARWSLDSRVVAAGTTDGVYLSHDRGETWENTSSGPSVQPHPVVSLAFDPLRGNILYAGTPHLAWKTLDGGVSWHSLPQGMLEDSDIFSIAVDGFHPRRLFAGACSGIYRSLDGGNTWVSLQGFGGLEFRTYVVARPPHTSNVLFAGTSAGLFESSNGGITWHKLSSLAVRSIAFDPLDSHRFYLATEQGVQSSVDGGSHSTWAHGELDRSVPLSMTSSRARRTNEGTRP